MSTREDIDRLARLLEADPAAGEEAAAEDRQLASLATLLQDARPVVPPMRAEFRSELRAQVLEAARENQVEAPLLTRMRAGIQRFRYSTGLAGATGIASMALTGGGVAGAAEHAQPGDLLYGPKLAIEDVRLALTSDDVARGQRALAYAQDRLDEAEQAVVEGDQEGAAVALAGADDRIEEGGRLITESGMMNPLLDLADALDLTAERVEALLGALDGDARQEAEFLLETVRATRTALGDALLPGPLDDVIDDVLPGEVPDPVLPDDLDDVLPDDVLPDPAVPGGQAPGGVPGDVTPDAPVDDVPLPEILAPPSAGGPALPGVPPPPVPGGDSLPAVPDTQGDGILDALPDDGVGDAVSDTLDGVGGVADDVVDIVPDEVQEILSGAPSAGEPVDVIKDTASEGLAPVTGPVTGGNGTGAVDGILGGD